MARPFINGLAGSVLALLGGCGTVRQAETPQAPPTAAPPPVAATPAPAQSAPIALSWDDDATRKTWSAALVAAVREHKDELDRGNPDAFIPGYAQLSPDEQVKFWAELVVAIAKYESNWNPRAHFKEPPPLNVVSLGLLQLSYEDGAQYHLEALDQHAREDHALEDPQVNLRCGVAMLAHLVARDGVVAAGRGDKSRGAARYWAVLRDGRTHRLAQIKANVRRALGIA
jgi:hypothetical protein